MKAVHHRDGHTLRGSLHVSEASLSAKRPAGTLPVAVQRRPCLRRQPLPSFPEPAAPAPKPRVGFSNEARVKVIQPCGQLNSRGRWESNAAQRRPDVDRRELSAASSVDNSHSCHYVYNPDGYTHNPRWSSERAEREVWEEMGWRAHRIDGVAVWMAPGTCGWLRAREAAHGVQHAQDLPPAVRADVLAHIQAWERDMEDASGWVQVRFDDTQYVWVSPEQRAELPEFSGEIWAPQLAGYPPKAVDMLWEELKAQEDEWKREMKRRPQPRTEPAR